MLARAAAAVADANKLIRALIILAHVVSADETPIRVGPGPKSRKRYLLVACTRLLTYYLLGDPGDLQSVRAPGHGRHGGGAWPLPELRAPRGALLYRLLSGQRMEEVSLGLMPYRRPKG